MRSLKINKIIILTIISAFTLGVIGYGVAYPSLILEYEGVSHAGCHGSSGAASSGTFTVTTSTSGRLISLTASIQGFTDALESNNNRSGSFSIGIPYGLGDNKEFGLGMAQNTVNGITDYWGVGIWEIELDQNGNTVNPLKFRVLAPETDGTYDLIIAVINAMNTTGDPQAIIYYHKVITVSVSSGSLTISSLTLTTPLNNLFFFAISGIIGTLTIFLVIKHKKK